MKVSEQIIREYALVRIAEIFDIPVEQLRLDTKFGEDLKASFVSDFRYNEFDKVDFDIRDVADRKITKELNKGLLTIRTVGDYCDHMVRCYETKPKDVTIILRLLQNKKLR
ncbi:MAG: hypothetical protein HZB81_00765 [Deltaproteobacteria bacterium]|nr:hypothetical protein [Deltaproteobacteria bacterium]